MVDCLYKQRLDRSAQEVNVHRVKGTLPVATPH